MPDFEALQSDKDAVYERTVEFDVSKMEPQVACPSSVDNVKPISEVGNVPIEQAFIGSCTNGRIEDLRLAAEVMKGKQVKDGVRALVIPASQEVYRQALNEGLMEIFTDAGAIVCGSACGPCLGGHIGLLAAGESCVSSYQPQLYRQNGQHPSQRLLSLTCNRSGFSNHRQINRPNKTGDKSMNSKIKAPAIKFGNNIDTDVILPGKYLILVDPCELAKHALESLDTEFVNKAKEGVILVGGKNFGCGSSREQAPLALKYSGVKCVIAESFARIFFRNAINIGLPVIECKGISSAVETGDELAVDFEAGKIENTSNGKKFQVEKLPPFILEILADGGLIENLRRKDEKMTEYKISLIPGDGIGPELTEATLKVLDAVQKKFGVKLKIIEAEAGDIALEKVGAALPADTVEKIKNSHACLKGPVGESAADVIVKLRVMFDLYANLRPLKAYPNVPVAQPRHRHDVCPRKHRGRLQRLRIHNRQRHNFVPASYHTQKLRTHSQKSLRNRTPTQRQKESHRHPQSQRYARNRRLIRERLPRNSKTVPRHRLQRTLR